MRVVWERMIRWFYTYWWLLRVLCCYRLKTFEYLFLQRKDKRNKTKVRDFLTAETIKSMVFCSKRTRICRRWWDRKFYVVAGRADREKEGKEQFTKKGASVRYLEVFSLTLLQKSQSFSGSIMQCKIQLQSASQSFKRTSAVCIVLSPSIRSLCNTPCRGEQRRTAQWKRRDMQNYAGAVQSWGQLVVTMQNYAERQRCNALQFGKIG